MAAGVFFTASLYHGWNMVQLQMDERFAPLPISWARSPMSVILKGGGLVCKFTSNLTAVACDF